MNKKLIGHVGVDSGQIMLIDPCYIDPDKWNNDYNTDGLLPEGALSLNDMYKLPCPANLPLSYSGACIASCCNDRAGELGNGSAISVSSGYGDGSYPVYVEYEDHGLGEVVARVIIDFVKED